MDEEGADNYFGNFINSFGGSGISSTIAKQIKKLTKNFQTPKFYSNSHSMTEIFFSQPKIKEALKENYQKVGRFIEEFGTPDKYVVFRIEEGADIEKVVDMYFELEDNLKIRGKGGVLLPAGEGLERHYRSLKKLGLFRFYDWKEKDSDYQTLLKAAKDYGRYFQMEISGGLWIYRELLPY